MNNNWSGTNMPIELSIITIIDIQFNSIQLITIKDQKFVRTYMEGTTNVYTVKKTCLIYVTWSEKYTHMTRTQTNTHGTGYKLIHVHIHTNNKVQYTWSLYCMGKVRYFLHFSQEWECPLYWLWRLHDKTCASMTLIPMYTLFILSATSTHI